MVFAAYEFVQKREERKGRREGRQEGLQEGRQEERERIEQELEALMKKGDGSVTISPEDIRRIVRGNGK